jgi:SAM-dependent methyltransferase
MEPLKELALFAYYWADRTCSDDCRQYHKNWSLIRFLDLDSQLPHHADYFIKQIQKYAQNKKSLSILISGSADTGLLAVVLTGIKDLHTPVEITLIDRCQTVLLQNQLFAQFKHITIKTIQTDIFELNQGEFDLILAHSFINFFDDAQHEKLFNKWHSLLKHGGQVLINNKSIAENLDSRIISDAAIEKKLLAIQKKINAESLPTSIVNSIKDFWSNQPLRHQIIHTDLLLKIAACGFHIREHTMIDQDGAGPIAGRYALQKRITNLMTLERLT